MDANPYTVEAEEPRRAANPLRFDRLSRELQSEILKRTHASFVVTHKMKIPANELALGPADALWQQHGLHFVPGVMRYEFKLQRRLADGPRMIARISRSLDPAFKQRALWHKFGPKRKTFIEDRAAKVIEIMPFSELKFDDLDASTWLFYFVHGEAPHSLVDMAPRWTRFARNSEVLDEVRSNIESVFRLPCKRM